MDSYGFFFFFFSSRRRHTRYIGDWSSDVCSSDLVEPDVRHLVDSAHLVLERVAGVRVKRRARQELPPLDAAGRRVETARARRVSLEVPRVDLDPLHAAGRGQPDHGPVVTRTTTAPGLPAVAHVQRVAGHDEIVAR